MAAKIAGGDQEPEAGRTLNRPSLRAAGLEAQSRRLIARRCQAAILRSKLLVWPQVEAAVSDMLGALAGPLLEQLAAVESRLKELPLSRRALSMPMPAFSIRDYADELAGAFRDINIQWIESMYRVEPADLEVLEHPRERIIDAGGVILFVEAQGAGITVPVRGSSSQAEDDLGCRTRALEGRTKEVYVRLQSTRAKHPIILARLLVFFLYHAGFYFVTYLPFRADG